MKWRKCGKRITALLHCLVTLGIVQIISMHWILSPATKPVRPGEAMMANHKQARTIPNHLQIEISLPETIIKDLNADIKKSQVRPGPDAGCDAINVTGGNTLEPSPERRNTTHKKFDIDMHSVSYSQLQRALSRLSDCPSVYNMRDLEYVGSGWTKLVSRGQYNGTPAAHKTVHRRGHDVKQCSEGRTEGEITDCYKRASVKCCQK